MANSAQISFAFVAKDTASATIRGLSSTISGLGTVASKMGGILKAGLKVGIAAIGGAIAGATAALYKFTKAAIEDEAAQAKLNSVLKARGMFTKENVAETEAMIKAGQRLAFTDDEIRDSLATATQFTKNFAGAQKLVTAAQDVARAKNISLERATSLIGKAYAGNTRALKSFGIELGKDATRQQVREALNKKFAGSAKTYATTTAGAIQSVQIAIGEAGETVGAAFLPIINQLLDVFYTRGLPILEAVAAGISKFVEENQKLIQTIITTAVEIAANLIPVFVKIAEFIFGTVVPAIIGFVQTLTAPGGVTDSIGKVIGGIMENLVPAIGTFIDGIGKLVGKVFELIGVLWGDGTGPLAIAVGAIGNAFSIVLSIIGNIGGAIATAIDFIMQLGKAIMDSPIGFLIKAIAGIVGGVGGAVSNAFGLGGSVTPASVTSGNGRDAVGGQYAIQTSIDVNLDGRTVAGNTNVHLGQTAMSRRPRTNP